ncbi:anthranilate phosphoribosyltransferase [Paraferrimonas sedimenticola]|uniref:Anthranilate phosphoribosyltransferase n=1 Tax=Paraferrimonas sedimenticola TaxID=375674 RepID=A0AA37RT98_9GAMM|nr:anthranilate phosphoribosyltransferase [Paraferrimonas sedimenticola]GLP94926.1 anthranilate phosphoribosyltransferase [Paraferrimonas sedimenticola]
MQALIDTLMQGQALTRAQTAQLFSAVVKGEVEPVVLSAVLVAMKLRGETIDEIAGAADALRAEAKPFPKCDYPVVDIVGTGGDGHHTINVSTTSSIVAAAAGAKVTKHGNRSVSSKSGSSDLLTQLGINLTMSPETAKHCLDEHNLTFLFAPHYHAGVRHAMPVRQALKTRTLFNILGPLINPAHPQVMLLGVYLPELVEPIAQALVALGVENALVVHGEGLDELALHGTSKAQEIRQGALQPVSELSPADFGLSEAPLSAIKGGTPEENQAITLAILEGKATQAQTEAVLMNAGAALKLAGLADSYQAGAELAREAITSGAAMRTLQGFAQASQQEANAKEGAND